MVGIYTQFLSKESQPEQSQLILQPINSVIPFVTMVKATLPLALVALLLSLATTQAATIPVQKRDSSGQWNAILSVSKNADITVKDLCRGVLPPVIATFISESLSWLKTPCLSV
jgi:hypothetical protein